MGAVSNIFIRISLFLFLISLSTVYFKYAVADFYYETAFNKYKEINIDQERETERLLSINDDVDKSLAWRSTASEPLDLKANSLYGQWWVSPDAQFYEESKLLQEANNLIIESLINRKTWSFGYSQLALIHSQKKVLDSEFSQWFAKAYEVGRYETSIARSLMQVGLINWGKITVEEREMTIEFIRISIEQKANSPRFMRKVLLSYGRLDYICNLLMDTERKDKVCL